MDSLIWEDGSFVARNIENFRRRDIATAFLWLTFNVVPALWLSAFVDPGSIISNLSYEKMHLAGFHGCVFLLMCVFLVSGARHMYLLSVALGLFSHLSLPFLSSSRTDHAVKFSQLGPSLFRESPSSRSFIISRYSSPDISWYKNQSQSNCQLYRTLWCPAELSTSVMGQSFVDHSPVNTSSPQSASQFLPPATRPLCSPLSPLSFENSWSSPLFVQSRRSALCRWNSCSSSISSLQYQLSPSLITGSSDIAKSMCSGDGGGTNPSGSQNGGSSSFNKSPPCSKTQVDVSEYWKSNNVTAINLERWTVNIRRWLHGTILRRVVDEIVSVNSKMSKTSQDGVVIGSTTLSTLEQLAKGKYQHISSLPTLLRFLECTKEQSYYVFRLQELARGSCLGEFRWDGGSRSNVSPWKDYLPNDTMILLHLFSTYMDACLPPHPKCLSGRPFSQLHLVRTPDKPDLQSKYTAQLYVTKIQPPSVKVVFDGVIYTFPPGRNSFYHALLMFFHLYNSLDGTIRSISLGPSGLNLAWIFEKK